MALSHIQNFLVGRDELTPQYRNLNNAQRALFATIKSGTASMAELTAAMQEVGGAHALTATQIRKNALALASQGSEILANASYARTLTEAQIKLSIQTSQTTIAMTREKIEQQQATIADREAILVKLQKISGLKGLALARNENSVATNKEILSTEEARLKELQASLVTEELRLQKARLTRDVVNNTAALRANEIAMDMGTRMSFEGSVGVKNRMLALQGMTAAEIENEIAIKRSLITKSQILIKNAELAAQTSQDSILKTRDTIATEQLRIAEAELDLMRAQSVLTGVKKAESELAQQVALMATIEATGEAAGASALRAAAAEIEGKATVEAAYQEMLATQEASMVKIEAAGEAGAAAFLKATAEEENAIATRDAAYAAMLAAKAEDQLAAIHNRTAAATVRLTAAQEGLAYQFAQNRWLGVSMGGVVEKVGMGARLSGFDVGFMAFHLSMFGIAAALATSALNVLGDEMTSVEQLRYAVENLGLTWDRAGFEERILALRDATGNTAREIREVMATLGAVTGGLIHSQEELVDSAELVLDIMLRTGASAQLASRIVARTMAGNLESLRERFPGLTAEIDRLRESGASLEEMGDWGMAHLREQVAGAASEISTADKITRSLRNSLINIAISVGRLAAPVLGALAVSLRVVSDALVFIGPLLPWIAVGFVTAKVAAYAYTVAVSGATAATVAFGMALTLWASPATLVTGIVLGVSVAILGVKKALESLSFDPHEEAMRRYRTTAWELRKDLENVQEEYLILANLLDNNLITWEQFEYALRRVRGGFDEMREANDRAFVTDWGPSLSQRARALDAIDRAQLSVTRRTWEYGDAVRWMTENEIASIRGIEEFETAMINLNIRISNATEGMYELIVAFRSLGDLMRDPAEVFGEIDTADFQIPLANSVAEFDRAIRDLDYKNQLDDLRQQFIEAGGDAGRLFREYSVVFLQEDNSRRDEVLNELESLSEEAQRIVERYFDLVLQRRRQFERAELEAEENRINTLIQESMEWLDQTDALNAERAEHEAEILRTLQQKEQQINTERIETARTFWAIMQGIWNTALDNYQETLKIISMKETNEANRRRDNRSDELSAEDLHLQQAMQQSLDYNAAILDQIHEHHDRMIEEKEEYGRRLEELRKWRAQQEQDHLDMILDKYQEHLRMRGQMDQQRAEANWDMIAQSISQQSTTFAERISGETSKLVESPSFIDLWHAPAKVQEAWTGAMESTISGIMGIGRPLQKMMGDSVAAKAIIWMAEAAGQIAYAAANFMDPMVAAQHAAAAAAFIYAASQAGKAGGKGGRSSSTAQAPPLARRRQALQEQPDLSLRSPSGLTFVNVIDLRNSVGMDGRRIGNELINAINQGSRFRSGHRLSGNVIGGNWGRY